MPGVKLDDDFSIEKTAEGYVLLNSGGKAVLGPFTLTDKSMMKKIEEYTGASEKAVESAVAELAVLSAEETKQKTKADKEKKARKQFKDSGFTADGCFEAIYVDDKPCFLVKNNSGGDFRIVDSVEIGEKKFFPKEVKHVPYEPYTSYEGPIPSREELYRRIWSEFDVFIDVEPIWKEVASACVLLTYHQEKLLTILYLFLYGDNESGKSTFLQLLKFLCYRPMYGVTIPAADLYGYLEDSDGMGCILEDEVQGIQKDTDKIKIYKAGYKQGAVVPRTLMTQFDRIIKYYRTFCFKACASEQIPQVKGFNERFVFIPMVEGYPKKEWADITKEDLQRLRNLRNMLLKWRMQSRDWELPDVQLEVKGRLKELWKPILQITHGLTVYDGLFRFVEDQRKERLSVKQDTLEGNIVKVVIEIVNKAKDNSLAVPFQTIWSHLQEELDGKIDEKKPHVMETSQFFQVTKNKVGYRLREVLSGKSKPIRLRKDDGVIKAYEFEREKLRRVSKKYGYELVTKLPTEPSSEGVSSLKSMDEITLDNVEKEPHTPQQLGTLGNSVTEPTRSFAEKSDPSLSECGNRGKQGKNDEREQLEGEEVVQKLRAAFTPDRGYSHDKVKAILLQEGFSDSAAELKMLDLERARIITVDDANTVFLVKKEES